MLDWLRRLSFVLLIVNFPAFAAEPDVVVNIARNGDEFVIDASIDIPVSVRMAWDVFTDFDHMAEILSTVTSSKIVSRHENTLFVQQQGIAKFGAFSYSFSSEREIQLEPMKRVVARQISGNAKRFESVADISPNERGTHVLYHAEMVPDSVLARIFGAPLVKTEFEGQFTEMAAEMLRRKAR